jgi:hypothetical protein
MQIKLNKERYILGVNLFIGFQRNKQLSVYKIFIKFIKFLSVSFNA